MQNNKGKPNKSNILLFIVVCVVVFLLLITQISLRRTSFGLKIGDVATTDITAPKTITYVSDILTEEARQDAADNVNNIYLPADPSISRTQVQNLRYTFQFINVVRNDEYSSRTQKIEDINKISVADFDESTIEQLLDLSADDWSVLQEESISILENVMRNSIRETQVVSEIQNIPAMINYYISQSVANLVNTMVSRFITANSLYSAELTEKSREEAKAAVQPRERTYVINQTIVQKGQIVTALNYEALNKLGLVVSQNNPEKYISVICIITGLAAALLVYIHWIPDSGINGFTNWLVTAVLFLIYFIAGRMLTPNHTLIPYVFPASGLGLTLAALYGTSTSGIIALLLAILIPYDFSNAIVFCIYYLISSLTAIVVLGKQRSIGNFLKTGIISGLVCIPIVISYQFMNASVVPDTTGLVSIAVAVLVGSVISATLSLLSHYIIAGWLGIVTPTQLMELIRPDSPLLQFMLSHAPGTYQHCLQVANLAEQAARDIGADSLLTRAGAMYHDVGKSLNPMFFVENQVSGVLNLHADLTPQESAATIMKHVTDGVELAHQYHLPPRIIDFILQHHGTNMTRFQYGQAVEQNGAENVDPADFTYPGPIPNSKETALVMLADSVEARARAERPTTKEEISELVKSMFNLYSNSGQMDNTPLTFRDLTTARQSFERVLQNIYHPRVLYPGQKRKDEKESKEKAEKQNNGE
ncbi:MAG: HDIG domain-containing protein [Anaerolineaceae bacterium]|nr:HDIG domain-containing protein [Anaerolineaceae bacterium]